MKLPRRNIKNHITKNKLWVRSTIITITPHKESLIIVCFPGYIHSLSKTVTVNIGIRRWCGYCSPIITIPHFHVHVCAGCRTSILKHNGNIVVVWTSGYCYPLGGCSTCSNARSICPATVSGISSSVEPYRGWFSVYHHAITGTLPCNIEILTSGYSIRCIYSGNVYPRRSVPNSSINTKVRYFTPSTYYIISVIVPLTFNPGCHIITFINGTIVYGLLTTP